MAFKAQRVVLVERKGATVRCTLVNEYGVETVKPLAFIPRQDLRVACAVLGLSGASTLTNDQMRSSIVEHSEGVGVNGEWETVTRTARVVRSYAPAPVVEPVVEPVLVAEPAVVVIAPEPVAPVVPVAGSLDAIVAGMVANALAGYSAPMDAEQIDAIVTAKVDAIVSRPIVTNVVVNSVVLGSFTGRKHRQYPQILAHLVAGDDLYLWGGAGAGKTTTVQHIARDLGRRFELVTFSSQTTEAKLVGFRDATGEVRTTPLVEALMEPSVVLFDEWDACPSGVAITVNAVSANRLVSTPAGTLPVHPECILVFSGNTSLDGATSAYNGRAASDFSTKDRLSVVEFLIDEDLERDLTVAQAGGSVEIAETWLRVVRKVRSNVIALGPTTSARIAVTPRASYSGARLLAAGMHLRDVADARLRKGMDARTWDQVRAGVPELA